ncbi:MAG: hypothetical protein JWN67_4705 [Actinomycetia bacterium]|nr:hypothetical protein [Actinomycetes bacterium]
MDDVTEAEKGPLLSMPEVGRRLGITTREAYDLLERGDLPGLRTAHGMRVPVEAVEKLAG